MGVVKFVINLPERRDRRREMEDQLHRVGWDANFFPAIRPQDAGGFPSIGARGCFLSHLAALKLAPSDRHVVLIEDDLNFTSDFPHIWESAFAELERSKWSIFYPAHYLNETTNGLVMLSPECGVMCAHFMVIHQLFVQTIIQHLEAILLRPGGHPDGGPMHLDGAYATIRARNPELRTFVLSPSLGYQRPSRSDIADLKLLDRINALRPMVSAMRKVKNQLFQ